MEIRQNKYQKTEPPKDRIILGRMKPNSWPHLVQWDGEAWKCAYFEKAYPADALIAWAEVGGHEKKAVPVVFDIGVKL